MAHPAHARSAFTSHSLTGIIFMRQLHRKTRSVAKPAKRKNAPLKKRSTRMNDETRWAAVQRRDAAFDGEFVYAVRTTGVYCKPSCASRRALRKNVSFFDSTAAAEHAGFR